MEDNSLSFVDPDKSLVIWDFIEGGKNADQYEQQISEATSRNRRTNGYLITSNVSSKPIEILKRYDMTIHEVVEQNFGTYLGTHTYRVLRNGRLIKDNQKFNEFEKGSMLQLFFIKRQSEEILEEKNGNINSYTSRFEDNNPKENKATIEDDIEAIVIDDEQFELGFNFFEDSLTVN